MCGISMNAVDFPETGAFVGFRSGGSSPAKVENAALGGDAEQPSPLQKRYREDAMRKPGATGSIASTVIDGLGCLGSFTCSSPCAGEPPHPAAPAVDMTAVYVPTPGTRTACTHCLFAGWNICRALHPNTIYASKTGPNFFIFH